MQIRRLFVYGSLKTGFGNHALIEDKVKVGDDAVEGFCLYTPHGFYPYAFREAGKRVTGEVYWIDQDTLEILDRLEGVPHHYERIAVNTEGGRLCWIYCVPDGSELKKGNQVLVGETWENQPREFWRKKLAERAMQKAG